MDNFKCLVFAQGLTSGRDAEIRPRVLTKLESESSLTLQKLTEDFQKIEIIKKDSKGIESGISHIKRVVKQTKTRKTNKIQDRKNYHTYPRKSDNKFEKRKIPSPCYRCGGIHWVKDCPYLAKICLVCKKNRTQKFPLQEQKSN